jgi:hypothetical protein
MFHVLFIGYSCGKYKEFFRLMQEGKMKNDKNEEEKGK